MVIYENLKCVLVLATRCQVWVYWENEVSGMCSRYKRKFGQNQITKPIRKIFLEFYKIQFIVSVIYPVRHEDVHTISIFISFK